MKVNKYDLKVIGKIIEKLEDDISKEIFTFRVLYSLTGDERYIYDMMSGTAQRKRNDIWKRTKEVQEGCQMYENGDLYSFLLKNYSNSDGNIVIFGAGNCGKKVLYWLRCIGFEPKAFCDNNLKKCGTFIDNCRVISCEKLETHYHNAIIIIASYNNHSEIRKQLSKLNVSQELIYEYEINGLATFWDDPYFDSEIFQPRENEIFIDAGAFHGETAKEFAEWCPSYDKIYCIEPDKTNFIQLCKKIDTSGIRDIELKNMGLWNKKDKLSFERGGDNGTGSHIEVDGKDIIEVTSLDELLDGNKATFIKMDIEGAEKEALKGAVNTIKKYKPRLAICIYHKKEDIIELPKYIMELVPEYKIKIRHYSTCIWDTILYAYL